MDVYLKTDCYDCLHFVKNGHMTCQKLPRPTFSDKPTDNQSSYFFIPCDVDFFHPQGLDIHCNSFIEKFKETLF